MKQVVGMRAGVLLICGLLTQHGAAIAREQSNITLGRAHYYSLIDKAAERHWAVPLSLYVSSSNKGYSDQGCLGSLSSLLFGTDSLTFADIHLVTRLSYQGKIHVNDRADVAAGVVAPQSGDDPSQQYLNLVAPTRVNFGGIDRKEAAFNISAMYRARFGCEDKYEGVIGIAVPVKHVQRSVDVAFDGGTLFGPTYSNATTSRRDALQKFFGDFSGLEDFFIRGILAPKGITFAPRVRKTGLGDVSVFGSVGFTDIVEQVEIFQVGANVVFPSGGKDHGNELAPVILGNGGAYQVELFVNVLFKSCLSAFNPTVRLATGFSSGYTGAVRVPALKSLVHIDSLTDALSDHKHDPETEFQKLRNLDQLVGVPPTFIFDSNGKWYTDSFQEYDSLYAPFADRAYTAKIKQGNRFLVSVGNYFYNVFNLNLRLGVFYDYLSKAQDTFCLRCLGSQGIGNQSDYNVASLQDRTSVRAHNIGWHLAYKFENMLEVDIGSHHTFAGRNTPRVNEAFISFVTVF